MKVLDRLNILINQFEEEAALCKDKGGSWIVMRETAASPETAKAVTKIMLIWDDRRILAKEMADLLRELKATCEARGMTPTPKDEQCICPDHATDEACPVCIPGYEPK